MSRKNVLTCVVCPMGCRLNIEAGEDGEISVSGNSCRHGLKYGVKEYTNPERTITTTVPLEGGKYPRLPVRSARPIPKDKIFDCMRVLQKLKVKAPVDKGDIIVRSICDTGVDIVASRSVE